MAEILILSLPPANRLLGKGLRSVVWGHFLNKLRLLTGNLDPPRIWVYIIKSGQEFHNPTLLTSSEVELMETFVGWTAYH